MGPRFPWLTEVCSAALLTGWFLIGATTSYGVSTVDGWWPNPDEFGLVLLAGIWLVPALVMTVFEAICVVAYPTPWPARIIGIVCTLACGFVGLLPVGLRFAGDESPVELQDITLSLLLVGSLVAGQIMLGSILSRLFSRRASSWGLSGPKGR